MPGLLAAVLMLGAALAYPSHAAASPPLLWADFKPPLQSHSGVPVQTIALSEHAGDAKAETVTVTDHGVAVQRQETLVKKHLRTGALHTLAVLFSTVTLVACGGGASYPVDGAPSPRPAPAPGTGTGADTAFATPSNATDTVEAGKVQGYAFAEKAPQQNLGAPQFADGAVTLSAPLSAAQAFAGVALRAYAPNNTGAAPVAPFDASAHTRLKIQLKSSTDALLQVKLQPAPVAADGCSATANVMVNATLAEVVIDLDDTSFPLPDYCNGAGSKVGTVKAGLYAIDVINPAVGAGAHDVSIGTVKLSK